MKTIVGVLFLLLMTVFGQGGEVVVPLEVDSDASSLQLALAVNGQSSTNTQPLSDSLSLAVDCLAPLVATSLRDFQFRTVTNYKFTLLFGLLTAGATNVEILHPTAIPQQPYTALVDGVVTLRNIPNVLSGTAGYRATGFACDQLQSNLLPCQGVTNLVDVGTIHIPSLSGTLILSKGTIRFDG